MEEIIIYRGLYYADIFGINLLLDNHAVWYRVQDEISIDTLTIMPHDHFIFAKKNEGTLLNLLLQLFASASASLVFLH